MPTLRKPIGRPRNAQISDRAVGLWLAMGEIECTCAPPADEECPGCKTWWNLYWACDAELRLRPWQRVHELADVLDAEAERRPHVKAAKEPG